MNPNVPDELRKQLAELSEYEPFLQEMEAKQAHDMEVMKNIMGCIMHSVDKVGIDTTYQLIKNTLEGGVIHPPVEGYIEYVQHRKL